MLNWPTAFVLITIILCVFILVMYVIGKRMEQNDETEVSFTSDKDELKRQIEDFQKLERKK